VAGRRAGDVDAGLVERRDALEALLQERVDVRELAGDALLREVEDDLLGLVDEVAGFSGTVPAEAGDLTAGADEAAQRRGLAHDAGVVGGVRRRRHERCELVQAHAAAHGLELAPLLELVGEGDRIDGLALRVQGEGGSVDLRVPLPVDGPVGNVGRLAAPDVPAYSSRSAASASARHSGTGSAAASASASAVAGAGGGGSSSRSSSIAGPSWGASCTAACCSAASIASSSVSDGSSPPSGITTVRTSTCTSWKTSIGTW